MGEFQGLIDLISMKALKFKTEDLGSTFTVDEISPTTSAPTPNSGARRCSTPWPTSTRTFGGDLHGPPRRRPPLDESDIVAGTPPGHPDRPALSPCYAAPASNTSASSACSTPSPRTSRARWTSPRSSATTPKRGRRFPGSPRPRRAVLRPRFQGHVRRPRRPLVRPRLLRPPQGREPRVQPRARQERELLPPLPHPRRRAREGRRGPPPATSSGSSA